MNSNFYTTEKLNSILDKILDSGINSLSIIEHNILKSFSTSDEEINEIIRVLSKLSDNCKYWMVKMEKNTESDLESNRYYLDKWTLNSRRMSEFEQYLKNNFGLGLLDYELNN